MDPEKLSEADKHLVYGLLLKKKRTGRQERRVLGIVRSSMEIGAKITAILQVTRAQIASEYERAERRSNRTRLGLAPRRKVKKENVVVVDVRAEIADLLKKSSLKRSLSFLRISERYDAVQVIFALRVGLIIVNEVLPSAEEYARYVSVCRAIQPGVRIIFLGRPSFVVTGGPGFQDTTRFLEKPLSFEKLEESARLLLGHADSSVQV